LHHGEIVTNMYAMGWATFWANFFTNSSGHTAQQRHRRRRKREKMLFFISVLPRPAPKNVTFVSRLGFTYFFRAPTNCYRNKIVTTFRIQCSSMIFFIVKQPFVSNSIHMYVHMQMIAHNLKT
jgi:hypothetical protein